jgi:hypothetical protein
VPTTILNIGGVYGRISALADERALRREARDWLVRRLPVEAARREEWTRPRQAVDWAACEREWDWLERAVGLSEADLEEMRRVRDAAKEHVARAEEKGERIGVAELPWDDVDLVADWLATLPTEDTRLFGKLRKVTWDQAEEHSRRWHERLKKQREIKLTEEMAARGIRSLVEFPDGWRWVRLETVEALQQEGSVMHHCVGRGGYNHMAVAAMPSGIYSLRSPDDRPLVTVEVDGGAIRQARGPSNRTPEWRAAHVKALVSRLGIDPGRSIDPGFIGMGFVAKRLMPMEDILALLAAGEVEGDVVLRHTEVERLPAGTSITGSLDLGGCHALVELPAGLKVGWKLDVSGCTSLAALPDGMSVEAGLDAHGCGALARFPKDAAIGGNVDLGGCRSLAEMPAGLRVRGGLNLSGCSALVALPEGLHVEGNLDAHDCVALARLPKRAHVGGELNLWGCPELKTRLGDGFTVKGWVAAPAPLRRLPPLLPLAFGALRTVLGMGG